MKLINDIHSPSKVIHVNTTFDFNKGERLVLTKKRSKEGRYELPIILDTTITTDYDKQVVVDELSQKIYKLFENVSTDKTIYELKEHQANLLRELNALVREFGKLTAISTLISRFHTVDKYVEKYTEDDLLVVINAFTKTSN